MLCARGVLLFYFVVLRMCLMYVSVYVCVRFRVGSRLCCVVCCVVCCVACLLVCGWVLFSFSLLCLFSFVYLSF